MNKVSYLAFQDLIKKLSVSVIFILLARYLTVNDFGKYQQVVLIVSIFTLFFSAGIPIGLSYFYGQVESYKDKVSLYKRFFFTQLMVSFFAVIVFITLSHFLSDIFDNQYLDELYLIIGILIFFNTLILLFRNLFTVTNSLRIYFFSMTIITIFSTVLVIIILINTHNIVYLIYALVVFSVITFFVLVRNNMKYFFTKNTTRWINKKEFKYIITMSSVTLVSVINVYIDQIMVSSMLSIDDYSNLRIGSFQIPFIGIISGSLLTVLVPIISGYYRKREYENIILVWSETIQKSTILLIPIIIFCLFFAKEIIVILFSEKYIDAVIIFQVYMFQWLRAVVILGGIMGAIGLEGELFKNTVFIAIGNIIINYIMITFFGVIGAAITTTVLNYLALVLLIKKIDLKLKKKFTHYFPIKIYVISLTVSILFSIIMRFLFSDFMDSILLLVLIAIIFYVVTILVQIKIFYNDISFKRIKLLL